MKLTIGLNSLRVMSQKLIKNYVNETVLFHYRGQYINGLKILAILSRKDDVLFCNANELICHMITIFLLLFSFHLQLFF